MPKLPRAGTPVPDNSPEAIQEFIDGTGVPHPDAIEKAADVGIAAPSTPVKRAAKKASPQPPKASSSASDNDLGFLALDDAEDFLNVLWYGREGTGKTTDVTMMANIDGATRVLIVNSEGGLKKAALRKRGVDTSKIVVWPKPGQQVTFDDLEALYYQLQGDLEEDPTSWTGVGFDSLTEIHKVLLDDIVRQAVTKAASAGKTRDRFFIDRSDYGVMSSQVNLLIRRFRDLQCHFGVTCLERRDQDDDTGKIFYGPALTPALQTDVLGYVDLVIRTQGEELTTADGVLTEFSGLTRPQGRIRAKDRFDATPRVMIDPDFVRVHAYVTETMDESSDPNQVDAAEYRRQAAELEAAQEQQKQARRSNAGRAKPAA